MSGTISVDGNEVKAESLMILLVSNFQNQPWGQMRPPYSNPDHGRWRNSPPTRGGHQRSYSSNDRNFNQNRDDVRTQVF